MAALLVVAFLAGLITSLSPCVLPVLPILLAGSATGGRRRPYLLVAGLVTSFTLVTLLGAALLDALGLPEDLLRNLGDRDAVPRRGDARVAAARLLARAPAVPAHAPPRRGRGGRVRRRPLARRRLRPVRGAGARGRVRARGDERRLAAPVRDAAGLRGRGGDPDARDRARRPARRDGPAPALAPARARRRRRRHRARDRRRRGPALPDLRPRLHRGVPGARGAERRRRARAAAAHRRARAAGVAARRLRPGARARRA